MSCPIMQEKEMKRGSGFASTLAEFNKLFVSCQRPLAMLDKCREDVITKNAGNCEVQAECYMACVKYRQQRARQIDSACKTDHTKLVNEYDQCVSKGEKEEVCLQPLNLFLDCAKSVKPPPMPSPSKKEAH